MNKSYLARHFNFRKVFSIKTSATISTKPTTKNQNTKRQGRKIAHTKANIARIKPKNESDMKRETTHNQYTILEYKIGSARKKNQRRAATATKINANITQLFIKMKPTQIIQLLPV